MKRTKYPIHSDFRMWTKMNPPLNKAFIPVMQVFLRGLYAGERSSSGITAERKRIPVGGGKYVNVLLYSPSESAEVSPCLIYYHGGGFVIPAAPYHFSLAREYAARIGCKVLFVDYRLAPKYPFPIPPEDCFHAYIWLLDNAEKLFADRTRIAVAGDSAGGNPATVVCLMARDRGLPLPCAQMLVYPAAGVGIETESMKKFTDTPMCNSKDAMKYDRLYIRDRNAGKWEYCSPISAPSLAGLPSAYIETAEFDCLRDCGIMYAERLIDFGVPTELYNTKGTMHGFDIVLKSPIVRECVDRRVSFLKKAFSG